MKRFVVCVAHGQTGSWQAICLDLDIAVQGRTFEEVQQLLNVAVASYVEDAQVEAEPARSALLSRRAPLFLRLKWAWRIARRAIFDRNHDGDSSVEFQVPCRA